MVSGYYGIANGFGFFGKSKNVEFCVIWVVKIVSSFRELHKLLLYTYGEGVNG